MNKNLKLRMGPATAPAATPKATKFWNMASVSEDEGEITLYGDVMSQQPVDWWTGEPEPGLYITPEGFMEDLEEIKGKSKITVKLNSCGGDLYTGIAIHNALKALPGSVNVIVEGIAASAASVIMCAGDTVTVFPGSLVMIHGVSVMLWDYLNVADMEKLIKSMDASEAAVAEIYNAKTGIDTEELREMMRSETWMTGREAIDHGFADELEEGTQPDMSMTADHKVMFVNGVRHNIDGLHVPGKYPVAKMAKPAAKADKSKAKAKENKGGHKTMTMDELRAQEPELVNQLETAARNSAMSEATNAERERLAAIDSIAASIPDPQLVADAKYGENPCTAQELSFRVMQNAAAAGQNFLTAYATEGAASGSAAVGAAPNGGTEISDAEKDAADINAVVNAYNSSKGGTR